MTVSAKELPLSEFLRILAGQYGVSVMWADSMDKRLVSVEAVDVPLSEIFEGLTRRFAVSCCRVGSSWYVGEFRDEDWATLVRKVGRLSKDDLLAAVETVGGDGSRAKTFADGLLVMADRAGSLRRVAGALDAIESARSDSWVLQIYLFSTSKRTTKELGVDTNALIDLSYAFAKHSLVPAGLVVQDGAQLAASFSAVMKAAATREDVALIGQPLFLLADGENASFSSGVSVPVAKKVVSDQGTVTTSGYEYVQSGLTAEAAIREGGSNMVSLKLKVSLGQITGFVEGAPVQSKDEFSTVAVLASSGVYLLGALDQDESRATASGLVAPVFLKKNSDKRRSQLQIWARLYRVGGPLK